MKRRENRIGQEKPEHGYKGASIGPEKANRMGFFCAMDGWLCTGLGVPGALLAPQ